MKRFGRVLPAVLLVVVGAGALPAAASGQQTDTENEVRIVARRLVDGRVEFGLQERAAGGAWGERRLPSVRFFPAGAQVGRWLSSAPLTLTGDHPPSGSFSITGGPRSGDTLVAASFVGTCSVRPDGGVGCWGVEEVAQMLGRTAALKDVVTVTIGESTDNRVLHACALHQAGTVSCWGPGYRGQLGQGDTADHVLPVQVPGIDDAVAVAAGLVHTCAVHSDGGVSCWGEGGSGQMGDGANRGRLLPARVPDLADVATISAGVYSTCAVHVDGTVSCWGLGSGGRPRTIEGLESIVSVSLGWTRACAVTSTGKLYCWRQTFEARPYLVENVSAVTTVSTNDYTVCVVHHDRGVSCWGEANPVGRLGDGLTTAPSQPKRVPGITDAVAVTVVIPSIERQVHACVVRADGGVFCWGNNGFGQLGDGTREDRLVPTPVVEGNFPSIDEWPTDPTERLRTWIELNVVARETEFPWLRSAWEHIRSETYSVEDLSLGGQVSWHCASRSCEATRMRLRSLHFGTVVHELAHVYDNTTRLVSARAWGAVQLYFASTFPECYTESGLEAGGEILADTIEHLVVPTSRLAYYNPPVLDGDSRFDSADCPTVPSEPSLEAEQVVRAGLAGQVPDWYAENIGDGAELWEAMRLSPSPRLLFNLADEFGGYCSEEWMKLPLNPARFPPEGANPFRDGGC